MFVNEIMNPLKRNVQSQLKIKADSLVADLNLYSILNSKDVFLDVVDNNGHSVGALRKDSLTYILQKQSAYFFINFLEEMNEAVIAIDKDRRIFFVNKAYYHILGVPAGKVLGKYLNTIEPDAALLNVLETGKPAVEDNKLIKTVNKYVATRMYPIVHNGKIEGAFSIFTDNTKLQNMSQQVQQLSSIAENYNTQLNYLTLRQNMKIVGENPSFLKCLEKAQTAAHTNATVLIRGENGTGKEILTNIIKENSFRKNKPFITVNCSAIPEQLIESELFGYEAGSFTGGHKNGRIGKFQLADGGTIFLDEIGDMPLHMQAKLLRVLQNGEIEKIGRQKNIPVDVRVIAATNQPLEDLIEQKLFRADLYYRLNVIPIHIPPLRERGNDIIILANHFLTTFNKRYQKNARFAEGLYQILLRYSWPGNVRELQNTIESAVVLCRNELIQPADLPNIALESEETKTPSDFSTKISEPVEFGLLSDAVDAYEKKYLINALNHFNWNKHQTMESLGISKRTFYRKLAQYDIKQ